MSAVFVDAFAGLMAPNTPDFVAAAAMLATQHRRKFLASWLLRTATLPFNAEELREAGACLVDAQVRITATVGEIDSQIACVLPGDPVAPVLEESLGRMLSVMASTWVSAEYEFTKTQQQRPDVHIGEIPQAHQLHRQCELFDTAVAELGTGARRYLHPHVRARADNGHG